MKQAEGRSEGPLYGPIVYALAGTLLASGLVLAMLMVAAMLGPFRLFGAAAGSAGSELALWLPPSAMTTAPAERARRLRAWRAAAGSDRDVRMLKRLAAAEGAVVALTDARRLSADELEDLRTFLRSGGGALVSGAIGVLGRDGSWRGWELMRELLGTSAVVPRDREASRALRAARRGPLTAGLVPGRRVRLHEEPGVPALAEPDAELEWSEAGAGPAGASRRLDVGRGRLVWIGAGPEAADEEVSDRIFVGGEMPRLVDAAVAWAGREPYLELLAWPRGAPLGALVERRPDAPQLHPPALADADGEAARRRALEAEIARSERSGGLFRIAVPAGALADPLRGALFERATARLRQRGAWFGERGEVAEWRRLHAGLVATLDRVGPRRRVIQVRNPGPETVRGAVLRVHLNDALRAAEVQRTVLQQGEPRVRLDLRAGRLDLFLPDLPGRSRQAWTLDLKSAREDA